MLWDREEYIAHMTFEYTGKELFCELFGPLIGLEEEWRAQGASQAECNLSAFGWDGVKVAGSAGNTGPITGLRPQVIEDTPSHTISRDHMGRIVRLCKGSATIALPLDYPVRNMDDWQRIKHWYAFDESRVSTERLAQLKALQQQGGMVLAFIPGGFDEPRQLMGEENLCLAFYEQPELIRDMLETIGGTALKVLERVTDVLTVDCLCVHEDMAGKSGPLAGPSQVSEFIVPYYRRVWDALSAQGTRLFSQDSDGNMNAVIDAFLDAGINVMYPCEPAAGMDIVRIREKYGRRLAVKGGIDKFALRGSVEDVSRELEYKINNTTMGGGTVFGLDHRIPNGVPIENYRYYVQYGRQLLGLPPAEPAAHIRMAF